MPVLGWRRAPPPSQFVQPFGKQKGVCRDWIAEYRTGKLRSGDRRVKSRNVEGVKPMSSQFGPKS